MTVAGVLSIVALVLGGLVGLAEAAYYFSHTYRPGVSPHLMALSAAVILLAVSVIVKQRE